MIRFFNVYYPVRTIARIVCEMVLVAGSFFLAAVYLAGPDPSIPLLYQNGILKIVLVTFATLLLTYYFDLYEPQRISRNWEIYFRLLLVISVLSFLLAGLLYLNPQIDIGPNVCVAGILILSVVLLLWRTVYERLIGLSALRERVFVLGSGDRARMVIDTLRTRRDAGMDVIEINPLPPTGEDDLARFEAELHTLSAIKPPVDRVIVAIEDRRGAMPVRQLLELRLKGVIVEDANAIVERLSGRVSLDGLSPSSLIFTYGFKVNPSQQFLRRLVSIAVSFTGLVLCLPLIPILMLAVRLSSPGPIFFRQTRVGLRGRLYSVIKFRTMRQDAEADGAVWATENDPRVTRLGRFMRKTRLDEIPQLWNVLRGEMSFVGPRPERPEFVQWLNREIPFYELRHIIRPGITGWAQVRYQYSASLEDTRKKLEYDLYYIKHLSLGLDLLIMFETVKTILLRRGAQ